MNKDKNYYLNLDYTILTRNLTEDEGGGILAYYEDMPFIAGDGNNVESATQDAKSAFSCYLDVALENGGEIKLPSTIQDKNISASSKKINITIPTSLLDKIDDYVESHHIDRDTFLVQSAIKEISV